jgi:hypothetical protein
MSENPNPSNLDVVAENVLDAAAEDQCRIFQEKVSVLREIGKAVLGENNEAPSKSSNESSASFFKLLLKRSKTS